MSAANSPLDPRDLSEVYFLVDAVFSAPEKVQELAKITLQSAPSTRLREAVRMLESALVSHRKKHAEIEWPELVAELKDKDRAVAAAIDWAIRNRPNRRAARR